MNVKTTTNEKLLLLETEVRGIKEEQQRLSGVVETFISEISNWRQRMGRPNWAVISTMIGGGVAALGFAFTIFVAGLSLMWFMITSQINSNIAPIRGDITYIKTISDNTARVVDERGPLLADLRNNASSGNQQRADLQKEVSQLRETNQDQEKRLINVENGLKEVETQFRANDEARNVQFAEQQRANNRIENTLHDAKLPYPAPSSAGPYYHPHIAKPHEGDGSSN